MSAEAGAETYEPEIAVGGVGLFVAECFLECEEDGRAAHVAVVAENAGTGVEVVWCDHRGQSLEYVASTRVGDDSANRPWAAGRPEFVHGGSGELRDGAVEEVAKFTIAMFETEFVAVGRAVEGLKIESTEAAGPGCAAPDRSRRAVAEQARADNDPGIIIEVENSRADFDRDAGNGGVGLRGEDVAGGA